MSSSIIFLTIFSEIIQFNLRKRYSIAIFLSDLVVCPQNCITLLAKKSNWLVDLLFEICLESKFLVGGEYWKN